MAYIELFAKCLETSRATLGDTSAYDGAAHCNVVNSVKNLVYNLRGFHDAIVGSVPYIGGPQKLPTCEGNVIGSARSSPLSRLMASYLKQETSSYQCNSVRSGL